MKEVGQAKNGDGGQSSQAVRQEIPKTHVPAGHGALGPFKKGPVENRKGRTLNSAPSPKRVPRRTGECLKTDKGKEEEAQRMKDLVIGTGHGNGNFCQRKRVNNIKEKNVTQERTPPKKFRTIL